MQLNHLNLCSHDVESLAILLTRHFGFLVLQAGTVPHTGGAFSMLRGEDGFSLVLTTLEPGSSSPYPADFHIGFTLDAPELVHGKHRELEADHRNVTPIRTFQALGSTWTTFFCTAGDGIRIEINAHT